jgi:predicted nucleic acid-binding protein
MGQAANRTATSWLAEVDEDRVFISVISFAEIRRGVEMLPAGRRGERLATWLAEELPVRFEARILDIDPHVAETWVWLWHAGRRSA